MPPCQYGSEVMVQANSPLRSRVDRRLDAVDTNDRHLAGKVFGAQRFESAGTCRHWRPQMPLMSLPKRVSRLPVKSKASVDFQFATGGSRAA